MSASKGYSLHSAKGKPPFFKAAIAKVRKRRIIETLAAFVGGGWLLLEFVHWILVDHYHFPEKTIDITFVTLLGALFTTLIWRWFSGREKPRKFKLEVVLIPLVILVTIVVDIDQVRHLNEHGPVLQPPFIVSPPSGASVRTLAVLPFRDIAGQPANEGWGIGMTDAIIGRLTSLSNLAVRPTSEILKYAKAPADSIQAGRELQVESVLDGTFQRAGELIRVSVQLVDCRTRASRWARNIDLGATDMLKFQDEMARSVVEALSIQLTNPEKADLEVPVTNSPEAYDLYFRAKSMPHFDEVAGFSQAGIVHDQLNLYQQAVAKDPNFAQAYLGIAESYCSSYFHEGPGDSKNPREKLERAQKAADRALQLNPRLASAFAALGSIFWFQGRFEESIPNMCSAITLAPNLALAWYALGHQYHFCGLLNQAEKAFRRAFELNPTQSLFIVWHAQILLYLGRAGEAEQEYRRRLAAKPDDMLCTSYLGQALFYQGKLQEAEPLLVRAAAFWWPPGAPQPLWLDVIDHAAYLYAVKGELKKIDARLLKITPETIYDGNEAFREAELYALMAQKDTCLRWLRRAFELGYWNYPRYAGAVTLKNIRSDPEFQRLLAQVKAKTDHYEKLFGRDAMK